jgi:hypothetical protein
MPEIGTQTCPKVGRPEKNDKHKKEVLKDVQKKYRERKKENTEKIKCECGSVLLYDCAKSHLKSKKHMNYIASIIPT